MTRPGRIEINKAKKIEQRADRQRAKEHLAKVRIKELWFCPKERGVKRHPDQWVYKSEFSDQMPAWHCEVCDFELVCIPGVIRETDVSSS